MSLIEFSTERIVLDRLRVGAQASVGRYVAANLEFDHWTDELTDSLVYRLRSEVLAHTLARKSIDQRVEFEHPASTWQMFKKAHEGGRWLGWIARRWPVRYATTAKWVTVEQQAKVAFPEATIQFPKSLGTPVYYQTLVQR